MAYRRRMLVTWNLRELFHFIELRSGPKGHQSYRRIAQETWRTLDETHPDLAKHIRVDLSGHTLSTLGAKPKGIC
jgi:thymidylate synthase ThyX